MVLLMEKVIRLIKSKRFYRVIIYLIKNYSLYPILFMVIFQKGHSLSVQATVKRFKNKFNDINKLLSHLLINDFFNKFKAFIC